MKSILIVSGYWPTFSNPISGIFVVQQVAALVKHGCKVTVVVNRTIGRFDGSHLTLQDLGITEKEVALNVFSAFRLPEKLSSTAGAIALNSWLLAVGLNKFLTNRVGPEAQYDGCIIHGLRYHGLSVHRWKRWIKGDVALVIHGIDPFVLVPRNKDAIKGLLGSSLGSVCNVVLVGNSLRRFAHDLGIPASKLRIVFNGTDLPNPIVGKHGRAADSTCLKILSVSNLIKLKGVDLTLKALAELSDRQPALNWVYNIVGDGPEYENLRELSQALGLYSRVSFLGRLSYEETMDEMADADIFVLPSWAEAFGIVYLEAMARCVPTIGCLDNGAADIITHGCDGLLVPPKAVTELSIEIEQLLVSPEYRLALGMNGRATAAKFSWEVNALAMLDIVCAQ
jgi:glycosyltransferase involved in cell wall biosynthesis